MAGGRQMISTRSFIIPNVMIFTGVFLIFEKNCVHL